MAGLSLEASRPRPGGAAAGRGLLATRRAGDALVWLEIRGGAERWAAFAPHREPAHHQDSLHGYSSTYLYIYIYVFCIK